MFKRITSKLLVLAAILTLALPVLVPAAVSADTDASKKAACESIGLTGSGCGANSSNEVSDLLGTVVKLLSFLVGAVAVIMIVVGGFKYITSGGDANKVGSAKTTIIYALVGLIIVALAQFIVNFVIKKI